MVKTPIVEKRGTIRANTMAYPSLTLRYLRVNLAQYDSTPAIESWSEKIQIETGYLIFITFSTFCND